MFNVYEWNKKIYRNEDGSWYKPEENLTDEKLWELFQIKSWPKFKDAYSFHTPPKWNEDVIQFIIQVQKELNNKIEFIQIKEKWCRFTVYFKTADILAENRLKELQKECIDRLISKGVHPPTQGEESNE